MTLADKQTKYYTYEKVNTKEIEVDVWGQRDVEKRTAQFNRI